MFDDIKIQCRNVKIIAQIENYNQFDLGQQCLFMHVCLIKYGSPNQNSRMEVGLTQLQYNKHIHSANQNIVFKIDPANQNVVLKQDSANPTVVLKHSTNQNVVLEQNQSIKM